MIEARGLTKHYGSTVAVEGLTFDVVPGQVTGFLGPNGAGKSTTMRLILGLDAPTAGTVTVGGRAYRSLRRPLYEVGGMLESRSAHPGRSARNHLLALAHANAIPARRVDDVLGIVGLESVAGKLAGTFSLGMTQRLGVAAALLGDPGILLLDEPVNGLDPEGVIWIRNLLRGLAGEGRTVFVSSHLMTEMSLTADHLIVIGRGKLIADTSVDSPTSNDFAQPAQVSTVPVTVSAVPESDAEIVRRYEPAVRRYCRSRTRSPEDADDAVQDTFMRFIRRGEGKVHNHEAWLITAAARACAQLNRRHRRDEERVSDARIWDGCMANEDERFSDRGVNDPERLTVEHLTISCLLRRLNERERVVVTHLYLMGADSEQVAKYLNVTPNNLRRIAFNARRHAQTILRGMERSESTADST